MQKKIDLIILMLLMLFLCGIMGFMSIITLTTVGFMEVQPLSTAGRIFTIFLLIIGFSTIFYGLGTLTVFIVEGEMLKIIRRKRMEKKISRLNDHHIICGSGEMGKHVLNEFVATKKPFVVIEKDEAEIEALIEHYNEVLHIKGDASCDEALKKAGIQSAKGVITTFASDKENLFVVLTARNLNPALRIVTRCMEEESSHKLRSAGADAVVSANAIGGMRMASEMLRPAVVSFLDIMLREKDEVLRVEEARVAEGSRIEGTTIKDANVFNNTGMIIIAIRESLSDKYIYNPKSDFMLKAGDTLVVLGEVDQVEKLRKYVA